MNIAATTDQLPTEILPADRLLTAAEFQKLADVPPEVEWFANISNRHTRRAYENAVKDFMRFAGIFRPEEFRVVTLAHLIGRNGRNSRLLPISGHIENSTLPSVRHRLGFAVTSIRQCFPTDFARRPRYSRR
jgi:hypothetical protein